MRHIFCTTFVMLLFASYVLAAEILFVELKGHNYITLVLDGETGELLYQARGKSSVSLTPFFEQIL